ncbi:ubiquinol-cytochrome c reductase iron-sulfur subunit [Blastopirellula marina]|uniref:(2Fe-2S)-binding protein n=1 Tax=Blastopirellula marina TaxID=124 RepID=A0A2S8GI32_9BACT|nr:Rieske 2Fe-2S domain-containing protein [Blastopirellula marina]PQO44109.1 (2Fe-2S)-binding protein [Blastopirellula marina]
MNHPSSNSNSPDQERRGLLQWSAIILGALATAAAGVPIIGFLLGPLKKRDDQWTTAGKVDEFPIGQTRLVDLQNPLHSLGDGDAGKIAIYVRRADEATFQIFAVNCTHLGCPVNWLADAGLFMCPCHGGVFYEDGAHASGPPPRGLYQYEHRLEKGDLLVKLGHLPTLQQPG